MKIIFIGTSEFAAIILEKLVKSTNQPFLVISAPDKAVGRKQIVTSPPVAALAEKYKIPVVQPEKISESSGEIRKLSPDLIILAAYGQIIPENILTSPKYDSINVHPSLLPLWRGPSPIQHAILNGDKRTGVTIMKMTTELDAGPILLQKEMEMTGQEDFQELHDKLAKFAAELLNEAIFKIFSGKISLQLQDDSKATYSKILKKEDGKIDWQKPAQILERQIRAFSVWPGSHAIFNDGKGSKKIKILKARVYMPPDKIKYPVGKVLVVPQNEIGVQCGKDFLVIERLQMEGKNEVSSEDFLRGYTNFIGTILK
ncbi:MAG: methionyl-tRNA formyltransferase [bacterium]|nr:methionyl-tRNA formyltransferase [bacterium]